MIRLPLGYSDFKGIIQDGFREGLVDKTLFIEHFLKSNAQTALLTRPRRFGKTLNMSMLRHFFDVEAAQENRVLFEGMKITSAKMPDGKMCMDHQGKYPVIYMTLKFLRTDSTFELAKENLTMLISEVYDKHRYLLENSLLSSQEKEVYLTIIKREASSADLEHSLKRLSEYLHRHYKVKPIILIDEYDAPFHASYLAKPPYYEEMRELLGGLLGRTFKDNEHLFKGLMTGILRISLLNLFSGTNNIPVFSVFKSEYAPYFGFTEEEVLDLLAKTELQDKFAQIKAWYNGYEIGGVVLYNPWSIINCLSEGGNLESYWVASAGTDSMIRDNLRVQNIETKQILEKLMRREVVEVEINERTLFSNLATDTAALWGLLIYAGYLKVLKVINYELAETITCAVQIPNLEVLREYMAYVQIWHKEALGRTEYHAMLQYLIQGDVQNFKESLQNYIERVVSYFDLHSKIPEQIYHIFLLGLIAGLDQKYIVQSNRESGHGRFDIVLIPQSEAVTRLGVVIELKSAATEDELQDVAEKALEQIKDKKYVSIFQSAKLQEILLLGIAFLGKKVCIAEERKSR